MTVGLETMQAPEMPVREFRGMSSQYLHALHEGERLNVFLEEADGFHLQDDVTKPMIFVSPAQASHRCAPFCGSGWP